jgi:hypothetical protein
VSGSGDVPKPAPLPNWVEFTGRDLLGRPVRRRVELTPPRWIPDNELDAYRRHVVAHGWQKHAGNIEEWGKVLSQTEYAEMLRTVVRGADRSVALDNGRALYEKQIPPNGQRAIVVINYKEPTKSTLFVPTGKDNVDGKYFDRNVEINWRRNQRRLLLSRPGRGGRKMKKVLLVSQEITDDEFESLALAASMMSFITLGPAKLVNDYERVSGETLKYMRDLADRLTANLDIEHDYQFEIPERDLKLLRHVFIYLRDVYGIENELYSVSGFEMAEFDRTLTWIEAALAAP